MMGSKKQKRPEKDKNKDWFGRVMEWDVNQHLQSMPEQQRVLLALGLVIVYTSVLIAFSVNVIRLLRIVYMQQDPFDL